MFLLQIIKKYSLRQLKVLTAFLLGASSISLHGVVHENSSQLVWYVDYNEAVKKSQSSALPMLIFFSGSDWNAMCMKIRKEVLASSEFSKKVNGNFVCLEVDFPKYSSQSETLRSQNSYLKTKFKIDEFPCLLLLSHDGREIYKISSFGNETGYNLGESLCHMVENDFLIANADSCIHTLSMEDLQKYYKIAEELSHKNFMAKALELGVSNDDYFFLSTKYRLLVESGRMDSEECQRVKRKLLNKDPQNEKLTHFTVALIEFQELAKRSQEGVRQDPSQVIAPLESYLTEFGQQDQENVWRIEMMIAQFYLDSDQWKNALQHAEVAFETAPKEVRSHISHSLDYIRHQS
ncbi:thioredoxin/thiol-disulfide isomerase [Chlamydia felis Fe/C-56]|uniref:Thioredoxin/thiol-disulfide isomerase n=1 Tax=Chlamydia felis (strain Fe/C-56) TaxID=264202 RepID=Q255T9_CHLFF|nr:thioredoxin family protein [Chlamydia felis]BAE80949.1 thioredoxin/thiol-disulfide isomerase [Chlamydia felis Fe/C-56]